MKTCWLIPFLCVVVTLHAEDSPDAEGDRRIIKYLQGLTDADVGKKLKGVRLPVGNMALAGNTLLHRLKVPSKRAHLYVLRAGSLAMGMPTAYAWVEPKGKRLLLPRNPGGEPRETAYSSGEVYTFTEIHPGDGLVEVACPTEAWIKSLQEPAARARWGRESMAMIEDADGFTNVRDDDGSVIATVKAGDRFLAVKSFEKAAQWEAYLPSGIVGLIHESRIRLLPDEPLIKMNFEPWKAEWTRALAEREAAAMQEGEKPHPDNYYPTLLRASGGDPVALGRFFDRKFEDAPADRYVRDAWSLLHLAGDERFAEMFKQHTAERIDLGAMLSNEWTTTPISDGKKYMERHFPRSFELLFGKQASAQNQGRGKKSAANALF